MTTIDRFHPIGEPGVAWGDAEKAQWRDSRVVRRSYADDVVTRIEALRTRFDVEQYGVLQYAPQTFPLFVVKSRNWNEALPVVVVTGGVHGYETSGVHGALQFLEHDAAAYAGKVNLVVLPCISPWGYERIQRWNGLAIDPNRSFKHDGVVEGRASESVQAMAAVKPYAATALLHIDLHETTDSDESEFRPALAARDGKSWKPGTIPDGFYLVDDSENPQPAFQQAIIAAVEKITHIAPADPDGTMIGTPVVAHGVIEYPVKSLGLCAGMTSARFTTTTEVYPDSPRATPQQ
ncbi:MAG TPA: peptidase, partial [Myxococcota bacterium]